MTEHVTLSRKELDRLQIMTRIAEKRLTRTRAAELLRMSERQVRRLYAAYQARGAAGLASAKRGRPSHRQLPQATRDRVVELIREHYTDFGPTFATEKLVEVHGLRVGVETVRLWMIEAGIWLPRSRRARRSYQPRERRACAGELVQIDGSRHAWFEDRGPGVSPEAQKINRERNMIRVQPLPIDAEIIPVHVVIGSQPKGKHSDVSCRKRPRGRISTVKDSRKTQGVGLVVAGLDRNEGAPSRTPPINGKGVGVNVTHQVTIDHHAIPTSRKGPARIRELHERFVDQIGCILDASQVLMCGRSWYFYGKADFIETDSCRVMKVDIASWARARELWI